VRGGTFALLIAALVLIIIFLLGLLLLRSTAGPSGNQGEQKNEPVQEEPTVRETTIQEPTEETPSNVMVRVSGTPGTDYQGTYSTSSESQTVEGNVGAEPTDYDANVENVDKSTLTAVFRKTQPGGGTLKVGIIADGEVIAESATSAEYGEVSVKWPSQESELKGTTLPGEFETRRSR
jgi:hypothetical protein